MNLNNLKAGQTVWRIGGDNKPYSEVALGKFVHDSTWIVMFDFDGISTVYSDEENPLWFETENECLLACENNQKRKDTLLKEIYNMELALKEKIYVLNKMDWEDEGDYYTDLEIELIEEYNFNFNSFKIFITSIFNLTPSFWEMNKNKFPIEPTNSIKKRKWKFLYNIGIEKIL